MRKLAIILLLCSPLWATTYYVSNAGSNASNGTSTGTSWAYGPGMAGCTSVCASTTLQPGDSVLYNKGDVWRDSFTVPLYTFTTTPLVFSNYGSGNNPLINGSAVTTGWTLLGGKSHTWQVSQAPVSNVTFQTWENNTGMVGVGTLAAVETTVNSWFYDGSTTLSINPSTNDNPNTNGKTYEVSQRGFCYANNVVGNSGATKNSYITFDGIDCTQTGGTNSTATDGAILLTEGDHLLLQNFSSYNHYRHCLIPREFSTNVTITNTLGGTNQIYNSVNTTPISIYVTVGPTLLEKSHIYQTQACCALDGPIIMHGGATNVTIQWNDIENGWGSASASLLHTLDNGTGSITIQHNLLAGAHNYVLYFDPASGGTGSAYILYDNLINVTGASTSVCPITAAGVTASYFYNNTVYGSVAGQANLCLTSTSTGWTVENNIFSTAVTNISVDAGSETSFLADYNDYFGWTGNFGIWGGSNKAGFSDWQTAAGNETHSVTGDPKLNAVGSNDFTLKAGSAAIDVGLALGGSYTTILSSTTASFPYASCLQTSYGSGYEIGAYCYINPLTPGAAMGGSAVLGGSVVMQ